MPIELDKYTTLKELDEWMNTAAHECGCKLSKDVLEDAEVELQTAGVCFSLATAILGEIKRRAWENS